jgi:hypothetical protein
MCDDNDDKLDKLFAAARSEQRDTEDLQEFFEVRLMARLRERREAQSPWYELAWRCVPAFALITVIVAICSITIVRSAAPDFFAVISSGQEEYLAKSFLSGE